MTFVEIGKSFSVFYQNKRVAINGKDSWQRRSDARLVLNNWLRKLYNERTFVKSAKEIQTAENDFKVYELDGIVYFKFPQSYASIAVVKNCSSWSFVYYISDLLFSIN